MNSGTLSLILSSPPPGGRDELSRIFHRLLAPIDAWIKSQKANVSEGYLIDEPDGLMLYVLSRGDSYDFELGKNLSEFSVRLADQGVNLNTTLLPAAPPEELTAFFDPKRGPAIRIPAE
jgi:hypothetical protein